MLSRKIAPRPPLLGLGLRLKLGLELGLGRQFYSGIIVLEPYYFIYQEATRFCIVQRRFAFPLYLSNQIEFHDQVYSNTRVPTQVNTNHHDSTGVRHVSTRINTSLTRVNTSPTQVKTHHHESNMSQHASTRVQNRSRSDFSKFQNN